MAPQGTASSVFTEFESNGWPTIGLACLVGLNGPVPYLAGADSTVHLSEELKNAAWVLPRSMVATAVSNYITSFIVVGTSASGLVLSLLDVNQMSISVTLMFCLGDIDSVVESPVGQPYIAVVLNATRSVPATKFLAVVILILVVSCSINGVTTTSRQLWSAQAEPCSLRVIAIVAKVESRSFARDGGLPFSSWLSQVRPGLDV